MDRQGDASGSRSSIVHVELLLRMRTRRCNRRCPRRQANPFQVPTDGPRLGDRSHDLHLSPAPITYAQLQVEHPKVLYGFRWQVSIYVRSHQRDLAADATDNRNRSSKAGPYRIRTIRRFQTCWSVGTCRPEPALIDARALVTHAQSAIEVSAMTYQRTTPTHRRCRRHPDVVYACRRRGSAPSPTGADSQRSCRQLSQLPCESRRWGSANPFGLTVEGDFLTAINLSGNVIWGPELAAIDSDGDGFTNGEELGDPEGTWQPGDPAQSTQLT